MVNTSHTDFGGVNVEIFDDAATSLAEFDWRGLESSG